MKFLLICAVLFLMFSISTSDHITKSYSFINSTNLAKPGCDSQCGDLIVPYPFGVGNNSDCYLNEGFRIDCDISLNPPKATIYEGDNMSIKLIVDSTIKLSNKLARMCYFNNGTMNKDNDRVDIGYIGGKPYSLSNVNKFTVIGCDSSGWLKDRQEGSMSSGCAVFCSGKVVAGGCTGNGCCQSSIPNNIITSTISITNSGDYTNYLSPTCELNCTYAFVGEENVFKFKGDDDFNDTNFKKRIEDAVPIVFEWAIGDLNCSEAKAADGFACQSNSICVDSTRNSGGYRCECKEGYEGNPYLSPGCQDINECDRMEDFPCYGTCINSLGSYTCTCKEGYSGDGNIPNDCRRKPFSVALSIGMRIGFLALLMGLSVLYFMAKKRKIAKLREKFYEQNGGALLEKKFKPQVVLVSVS